MFNLIKNEFIKFKPAIRVCFVMAVILIGLIVLHFTVDKIPFLDDTMELINAEFNTGAIAVDEDLQAMKDTLDRLMKGETISEENQKNAAFIQTTEIPWFEYMQSQGIVKDDWEYDCICCIIDYTDETCTLLPRGELYKNALELGSWQSFLSLRLEDYSESGDPLALIDYYEFEFLLETNSEPDRNTVNYNRAFRYAMNKVKMSEAVVEDDLKILTEQNNMLLYKAKNNIADAETNSSWNLFSDKTDIILLLCLEGVFAVLVTVEVLSVEKKKKNEVSYYIQPVRRSRSLCAKLIVVSVVNVIFALLIFVCKDLCAVTYGGLAIFERISVSLFGNISTICPLLFEFLISLAAMVYMEMCSVVAVFAYCLFENAMVSGMLGVLTSICSALLSYLVCYTTTFTGFLTKFTLFSAMSQWQLIVGEGLSVGQTVLNTIITYIISGVILVSLSCMLEKDKEI